MQDAIKRLVRSENAEMVVKTVEKKQHFFLMALFTFCIILPIVGGYNSVNNQSWWLILPLVTIIVLFLSFGILDSYRSQGE